MTARRAPAEADIAELLAAVNALREVLDEQLVEIRGLRRDFEAREERTRPVLRAQDIDALRGLLPVLAARYGDGGFSVSEVMEAAAERSPAGADLRLVLGLRKAQSVGKLLERAAGHVVGGLTVERAGDAAGGALWRCVASALAIETLAARRR